MTPTFTTFCAAAGPAITTASTSDKNAVSVTRMSSSPLLYLGSPGPIGPAFPFGKHAPRVSADAGGESAIRPRRPSQLAAERGGPHKVWTTSLSLRANEIVAPLLRYTAMLNSAAPAFSCACPSKGRVAFRAAMDFLRFDVVRETVPILAIERRVSDQLIVIHSRLVLRDRGVVVLDLLVQSAELLRRGISRRRLCHRLIRGKAKRRDTRRQHKETTHDQSPSKLVSL